MELLIKNLLKIWEPAFLMVNISKILLQLNSSMRNAIPLFWWDMQNYSQICIKNPKYYCGAYLRFEQKKEHFLECWITQHFEQNIYFFDIVSKVGIRT